MAIPIFAVIGAFMGFNSFMSNALNVRPALGTSLARKAYDDTPNILPDASALVLSRYRKELDASQYSEYTRQIGLSSEVAEAIYKSSEQLLNVYDYVSAWRRGIIVEAELDDWLKQSQLSDTNIDVLKKVSEFFPNPQDLVRFAVREVYTPNTVSQFGMMEDLPDKFIEEAEKAGVSEEQAKNYWAAHWDLPSTYQGFEMFHRRIITEDQLKTLLKALDIMPFWRDKLKEMAYSPLTRVDVRRMHDMGVLTREEVKDAYLDIGYSDENAERMTQFTELYNEEGGRDVTRSTLTAAFEDGIISANEYTNYMQELGYEWQAVELWRQMAEYERDKEMTEIKVDSLRTQYQKGDITLEEIEAELIEEGLPTTYVDLIVSKEQLRTANKIKMPTKTDLQDWLEMGIIKEKKYKKMMEAIGYRHEDVLRYLEEIAKERDTSERNYLSITVYTRWLAGEILTEEEFRTIAADMDYSEDDINRLIEEVEVITNESP